MEKSKISIIIPVYKVEKYLKRCVDSIIRQSYKNIEIILIDDGSPDMCPAICDEYAAKDTRVKVIHKENGGQSSARNAGMKYPLTGDYIAFVDSDDWIELDTCRYCIDLIEKYGADVVQYDVNITDSPDNMIRNRKEIIDVFEGKSILQYLMLRSTKAAGGFSVWGAIYARQLLDGLFFREGKINEDIDFKYMIMQRSKKLVVSNQKKYNYYQGSESTTYGGLKNNDFDLREAADLLANLTANESFGSIAFLGKVKQARTAFSLLSKIAYFGVADPSIDKKVTVKDLTKEHRGNLRILLKAPLPVSRKVLAVMFAVSFPMTEAVIHLAKKL